MSYLKLQDLTPSQLKFFQENIYNGPGSDVLGIKGPEFIFKCEVMQHDFEGFSSGSESDRIRSDKVFLRNCKNRIKETKKYRYYIVAYFYYILLVLFSKLAWDYYDYPSKNWIEFLKRVHVSIYKDKDILSKKISKRFLRRHIKDKN